MIFKIPKNPYDDRNLFTKSTIELTEGNTYCLVGCNGTGKTTVMFFIERDLIKNGAFEIKGEYLNFRGLLKEEKYNDNLVFSFDKKTDEVNSYEEHLQSIMGVNFTSTGEGIQYRLGKGLVLLRKQICDTKNKGKHLWVFFDDCDVGTSLDVIKDIKEVLGLIREDCDKNNITCTIILSANSYEMCRDGCICIDTYNFATKTFKDYETYKKFVLKSRERKDKSYGEEES